MTTSDFKQFVIGLVGSGKTTFLAALWHVVESGEVPGSMKLERLHGDQGYLNKIRDLWSDVLPLERTTTGSEQIVSMLLRDVGDDSSTEVFFPDMSGEGFRDQWIDRHMTKEYAECAREAAGGLLLVHPEKVREEILISDTEPIVKKIEAQQSGTVEEGKTGHQADQMDADQSPDEVPWNAELAPTQVQLVDLLQFVASMNATRPMKLAVVVSAWDIVAKLEGQETSPGKWVKKRLPLLWQYLTANFEIFDTKAYGVSAQGGDLKIDAVELRKIDIPSNRIRVVRQDSSTSHNISEPMRWIME